MNRAVTDSATTVPIGSGASSGAGFGAGSRAGPEQFGAGSGAGPEQVREEVPEHGQKQIAECKNTHPTKYVRPV